MESKFEPIDDYTVSMQYKFKSGAVLRYSFHAARTIGKALNKKITVLSQKEGLINGTMIGFAKNHSVEIVTTEKNIILPKSELLGWIMDPTKILHNILKKLADHD